MNRTNLFFLLTRNIQLTLLVLDTCQDFVDRAKSNVAHSKINNRKIYASLFFAEIILKTALPKKVREVKN